MCARGSFTVHTLSLTPIYTPPYLQRGASLSSGSDTLLRLSELRVRECGRQFVDPTSELGAAFGPKGVITLERVFLARGAVPWVCFDDLGGV